MFKQCSMCNCEWDLRDDFLADPEITYLGYQIHFEDLETGWLMFNHSCGTTLAFPVSIFSNLYSGPVFAESLNATSECPGFCAKSKSMAPCPQQCECAYIREVIQIINQWPKSE